MDNKQQIEDIKKELCDDFCKWPQKYREAMGDPDDAQYFLLIDKCSGCPLQRL